MAATFGELLRQLRRRTGMTQADLAAAVGFSEAQISRLEKNLRLPNLEVIATVFIPALGLQEEPQQALRLVELAAVARGEKPPTGLTIQRQVRPTVQEAIHAAPGHLPIPPTSLVGRERDLDLISKRIAGHSGRLFTVTGPPGVGKTRLALALASGLQALYADGAYFVPLAALQDAEQLPTVLVTTLGLTDQAAKPPHIRLIEFLRHKELLLVLDNFEQISPAAPFVAELLAACGRLHILVTSRSALKLRGEQRYALAPLELTAAVALFTERAQNVDPTFAPAPAELATLAAICRALDCLPLAIELNAAQIDLFTPPQLWQWLQERRLDALPGAPADLPAHHQTLRQAIERSYSLLNELEQQLFCALSAFAGGFDLAAVRSLGFDERTLQGLLQKSLVHGAAAVGEQRRFLLLETLRAFASEKLRGMGEESIVQQRHAMYFLTLAEDAAQQRQGQTKLAWLLRLDADLDNLRIAFQWFRRQAPLQALALAGALKEFWYSRGYFQEGRAWLSAALADPLVEIVATNLAADGAVVRQRARALLSLAQLAQNQGDYEQALTWVEASIGLYRQAGDAWSVAEALRESGWITYGHHDRRATIARFEESLHLFRTVGDQAKIAAVLTSLVYVQTGQELDYAQSIAYLSESIRLLRTVDEPDALLFALHFQGELELLHENYNAAEAIFTESLALARKSGAQRDSANALVLLSKVKSQQGQMPAALPYAQEGLAVARQIGDKNRVMAAGWQLGHVQRALGNPAAALACYDETLALSLSLGNQPFALECVLGCGVIAVQQGHYRPAASLLAAAQHLLDSLPPYLKAVARPELTQSVAAARTALGERDFAAAWTAGQAWSFPESVAAARHFCQL